MNSDNFTENRDDPTSSLNTVTDDAEAEARCKDVEHAQKESDLITMDGLVLIIENAKKKGIPQEMLATLYALWDQYPQLGEPPRIRAEDALAEVLEACWAKDLRHETLNDLLYEDEGEDKDHKLWEPQPESELRAPSNLYQLVRKAWDQGRMEELIAMIKEYEDLVYGDNLADVTRDFVEADEESEQGKICKEILLSLYR